MSKSELKAKAARYKSHISSQQKAIVKLKTENKELKFINDCLRGDLDRVNKALEVECYFNFDVKRMMAISFFAGVFVASLFIFIGQAVL